MPEVALVNMPFAPATRPSIQIGILKALLDQTQLPAGEFHAAIDFFDLLRQKKAFSQYTAETPSLVSEWYFSERRFDFNPFGLHAEAVGRLQRFAQSTSFPYEGMVAIREHVVPEFLENLARRVVDSGARVVCFTTSYAQLNPSFALAARLKALRPEIITVFGGAGSQVFEAMCQETMRTRPHVDVMLAGEAEKRFPELIACLLEGRPPTHLPKVYFRENGAVVGGEGATPALDLDEAGVPDYSGWLAARDEAPEGTRLYLEPMILMELGRGCTWGDSMTCKFCAFTFHGKYRGKSRTRVLSELAEQYRKYKIRQFYFVDDIINNSQITDIFPEFQKTVPRMTVAFMEMRTSTTKRHVQVLADAGVLLVQPGTENFDDGLLKRISKGTTTFHNIQFLKWAREAGVRVSHNVLLEVPGSEADEVRNQLEAIKLLTHLDPPYTLSIQLVRFSPYHENQQAYGFKNLRPDPFYKHLHPDGVDLEKIAYEFVHDGSGLSHSRIHHDSRTAIAQWQAAWRRLPSPYLIHETYFDDLVIVDGRAAGAPAFHRFQEPVGRIHALITDCPQNEEGIVRALGGAISTDEAAAVLNELCARRLALRLRGRVLSLAVAGERLRRLQPDIPLVNSLTLEGVTPWGPAAALR